MRNVGIFARQLAVFIHTVLRDIRCDIGVLRHIFQFAAPDITDFKNRAGLRVSLGEKQEIIRLLLRKNQQISLCVAVAHTGGLRCDFALTYQLSDFMWAHF